MNVGIYVRVSVLDKSNADSPETHEKRGRMYAESKGWNVKEVYVLPSVSGKSTVDHPETKRMLKDITTGKIQGLIFSKLARLARNTEQLLFYSNFFQEHNAHLISLSESIDTSTASGRLFYTLIAAMTQWERENNLERIHASIKTRRALGKFTGGNVSYGFKIVDARVVIDEDKAPIRALMYDLFLEHRRYATVARILNERGYRTLRNKKWSGTTVLRILKNTDAKGIRRYNYKAPVTKDNPKGLKPQSEWEFEKCPQIVNEEKWETVNYIIREQEKKSPSAQPLNKRVRLFTGFIFCEEGHKMSIKSKSERYTCKHCKYGIHKDDLEEIFLSRLKKFLVSDSEMSEYALMTEHEVTVKKDEIDFAQNELSKVIKKMDKLIELNIANELPTKGFKKHYDPLFERKEQLNQTIFDLEKQIETITNNQTSFKFIANKSLDFYSKWGTLKRHEKRDIIEMITNRIDFDNKTINFNLKQIAPLSSLELDQNGSQCGTM